MCEFQQLYSDRSGYVVRCNKCKFYQVLFSGTMLSVSPEEFDHFIIQISDQKSETAVSEVSLDTLIIPTPRQGVHLLLSINEFNKLCRMMELAEAEIRALAMMELFQN